MTAHFSDDVIFLEGTCPVEDAENLLILLQANPHSPVDLSLCTRAHGAVIQVLLAASPEYCGAPPQGFVQGWIVPNLKRGVA